MVTAWLGWANSLAVAAPASVPLLPDLNAKLHPSDSTPWTILFVLTLITLLPAILMCMTPLVRLLVVFHFLRQALGTQTAPSNPDADGAGADDDVVSDDAGAQPGRSAGRGALSRRRDHRHGGDRRGRAAGEAFLLRYAREKDLALFTAAGQIPRPQRADDLPMRVVAPAYILSELKAGFAIGAVLFLPVSADRHGDGRDHDLDRHVSVAAGGGLDAAEDSAVCDGGRMESAGQLALEELLKGHG
jgi:flagellar biosynthetic protein FliP